MKNLNFKVVFFLVVILLTFSISCSTSETSELVDNETTNNNLSNSNARVISPKPPSTQVPGPMCLRTATQTKAETFNLVFAPNDDILYDIRDGFLRSYPKGNRYVAEYYYCGNIVKDYSNLRFSTISNIINVMPSIYNSYSKVKDNSFSGIIINYELSNDLVGVLNDFKTLSTNSDYNSIINELIIDIKFVTGKNKLAVITFLSKD